jgi:hypothetical protein
MIRTEPSVTQEQSTLTGIGHELWNHQRGSHCKTAKSTEEQPVEPELKTPKGVKRWYAGRTLSHHHHPSLPVERRCLDLRERNKKCGMSFFLGEESNLMEVHIPIPNWVTVLSLLTFSE